MVLVMNLRRLAAQDLFLSLCFSYAIQDDISRVPETSNRGRGKTRGMAGRPNASREPVQMTASGPFGMGPAMAGSSSRSALRANTTHLARGGSTSTALTQLGSEPSRSDATVKLESSKFPFRHSKEIEEHPEVYSDPEDGVEIIDIEQIAAMDWMAPDVLRKGSHHPSGSDLIHKQIQAKHSEKDVKGTSCWYEET